MKTYSYLHSRLIIHLVVLHSWNIGSNFILVLCFSKCLSDVLGIRRRRRRTEIFVAHIPFSNWRSFYKVTLRWYENLTILWLSRMLIKHCLLGWRISRKGRISIDLLSHFWALNNRKNNLFLRVYKGFNIILSY